MDMVVNLVMRPISFYKLISLFPKKLNALYNLTLICNAVSKKMMFDNNGHIHAFSSGTGVENLLMLFFQNLKYSVDLVICCKVFPLNDFLTIFSIRIHRQPNLTLPLKRSRSTEGHNFPNIVELESLKLHA